MRLFLVSREHPAVEFEIVKYDKAAEKIVLRGVYDEYELSFPESAAEKRKLNWRLEKRDA
jgi:hypothetical protein